MCLLCDSIPYSQFRIPNCLLHIAYCLFPYLESSWLVLELDFIVKL